MQPRASFAEVSSGSGVRDIRHLYPRITENHLRYLEKWGLIKPMARAAGEERLYDFHDIAAIKQLANELDRAVPLKVALRALAAEHAGQLQLDFHSTNTATAKVVALRQREAKLQMPDRAAGPAPGVAFPFSDPQSALAAKYFVEGSRLDDGDEKKMESAAAAYRKALVIDPDLVPAIVNLANIHYARDELIEAQALYERASGSIRTASRRISTSATSITISGDIRMRSSAIAMPSPSIRATPTRISTWL